MTKSEFEKLGFRIEFLPSGRINICNKLQFAINGIKTIICTKGEYQRTFEVKSVSELFSYINKIEFI